MQGSFMNRVMEKTPATITPEIGMGATSFYYTDRHCWTIIAVSKNGKEITLQRDSIKVDGEASYGHQNWLITPDTEGVTSTATLRKNGTWKQKKGTTVFGIGFRNYHYDWSF
jgi:hypothetical protein